MANKEISVLLNKHQELLVDENGNIALLKDGEVTYISKVTFYDMLESHPINGKVCDCEDLNEFISNSKSMDNVESEYEKNNNTSVLGSGSNMYSEDKSVLREGETSGTGSYTYCEDNSTENHTDTSNIKAQAWNRLEILELIEQYRVNLNRFQNTSEKNCKVWQDIAKKFAHRSISSCKEKFKYLLRRYKQIKDSTKDKNTGGPSIANTFEFFDQIDEFMCDNPTIIPLATASSRGKNSLLSKKKSEVIVEDEDSNSEHDNGEEATSRKRKSSIQLDYLAEQKKMHMERMDMQKRKLEMIEKQNEKKNQILDKLNANFEKLIEKM